jgi:hypothetical protein
MALPPPFLLLFNEPINDLRPIEHDPSSLARPEVRQSVRQTSLPDGPHRAAKKTSDFANPKRLAEDSAIRFRARGSCYGHCRGQFCPGLALEISNDSKFFQEVFRPYILIFRGHANPPSGPAVFFAAEQPPTNPLTKRERQFGPHGPEDHEREGETPKSEKHPGIGHKGLGQADEKQKRDDKEQKTWNE